MLPMLKRLFKGESSEPEEAKVYCDHARARCRPADLIGHAYCPDCGHQVPVWVLINNALEELRNVKATLEV